MKLHPRKAITLWQLGDLPPQRHCLECGRGFFMDPMHRGRPYVTCSDQCSRQRNRMLSRATWHRTRRSRLRVIPAYHGPGLGGPPLKPEPHLIVQVKVVA